MLLEKRVKPSRVPGQKLKEALIQQTAAAAAQSADPAASRVRNSNPRRVQCDRCPYRTRFNYDLAQHRQHHGADLALRCDRCDYATKSKHHLVKHRALHDHQPADLADIIVFIPTKRKKRLAPVEKEDSPEPASFDPIVAQLAASLLKQPRASIEILRPAPVQSLNRLGKCEHCAYANVDTAALCLHVSRHSPSSSAHYTCAFCTYATTTGDDLREHLVQVHCGESAQMLKMRCRHADCHFACTSANRLIEHLATYHDPGDAAKSGKRAKVMRFGRLRHVYPVDRVRRRHQRALVQALGETRTEEVGELMQAQCEQDRTEWQFHLPMGQQ